MSTKLCEFEIPITQTSMAICLDEHRCAILYVLNELGLLSTGGIGLMQRRGRTESSGLRSTKVSAHSKPREPLLEFALDARRGENLPIPPTSRRRWMHLAISSHAHPNEGSHFSATWHRLRRPPRKPGTGVSNPLWQRDAKGPSRPMAPLCQIELVNSRFCCGNPGFVYKLGAI